MRKYETAIVWSTSLSEKELEKELSLVQETISAEKGTYLKTDSWGRRQLAYPIKKQTEGVYFFLRWDGEERVTAGIDKLLRINENCLRYLTLRVDDSMPEIVPPQPSVSHEPQAPAVEAVPPTPEVEKEPSDPIAEAAPPTPEVEEEPADPIAEAAPPTPEVEEESSVPAVEEASPAPAAAEAEEKVQIPADEEESAPVEEDETADEEEDKQ